MMSDDRKWMEDYYGLPLEELLPPTFGVPFLQPLLKDFLYLQLLEDLTHRLAQSFAIPEEYLLPSGLPLARRRDLAARQEEQKIELHDQKNQCQED